MKTIILVGIPGCGKTSILHEAEKHFPKLLIVNYGTKMLEVAALEGFDRDQIRKMPLEDLQQIGIAAAEKMSQEEAEIMIVDTHALIRTPTGFCPGLPKPVLEVLRPKAYAWVECAPSEIIRRRTQDASRSRDVETEEDLALHQELTRAYLSACSMETGGILCRISNDSPYISKNVLPLLNLVQSLT